MKNERAQSKTAISYGDDSPIAAFATPPAQSALTLIRCSGKGAIELAAAVFSSPPRLLRARGNTVLHGWITAPGSPAEKIDEVLVSVFRAPKSYTGEDSLDISGHGGAAAGRAIMDALRGAGFRDALPGEFTFRAFMNGKLDLTRSESVMELVSAKTGEGLRHAVNRLSGVLEKEITGIKSLLAEALAAVEIFLDYSEDEIDPDDGEEAGRFPGGARAEEALKRLKRLAASWRRERIYQEGILAVIAGRPNAGKSSLFNRLLGEERSIVTEIPGTTRDWIEAWVSIEGLPVRLADTAGLRDSGGRIEKIGVERSLGLLKEAELVLYVIDGAAGSGPEDSAFLAEIADKPCLIVRNKADIAPPSAGPDIARAGSAGLVSVSAKTGEGIEALARAIAAAVEASAPAEDGASSAAGSALAEAALGSARQKTLVESAAAAIEEALDLAGRGEALELIAAPLREAVNCLGEITGEVSTADIL
ncbi:MAG: tRNA uridine-5-carboxymethylaminomethyl(34) synthesis GTPase MnmE, partial [Treponema sp.]|nr:tRNA uridine-5-carboxymethylaminomethyl(34) synthesis GTPase MnmE [Treponema sp.]